MKQLFEHRITLKKNEYVSIIIVYKITVLYEPFIETGRQKEVRNMPASLKVDSR